MQSNETLRPHVEQLDGGMALGIALLVVAVFGFLSLYGWWFYFSAGPTEGPGAEVGLLAGAIALAAAGIAGWLKWQERRHGTGRNADTRWPGSSSG